MKNKLSLFILVIVVLLLAQSNLFAQGCVQCKLGPTSNLEGGGNVARGINKGILYLMIIPYMLIMSIVGYVFRKQLTEKWLLIKSHFGKKVVQQ